MPDESLSPLAGTNDWLLYGQWRSRQRVAGLVAAIALVLAFTVLVDGLQARMRGGGSYRLELLAGASEPVSGPVGNGPVKESSVRAFPIPSNAPLEFEFLGFFASYWFGSGMWRGEIRADETAESGSYAMAVGLEGQPSATFQTYVVSVARTPEEQRAQSLSFVRRSTGLNPFVIAALLGAFGVGLGAGGYFLGRRCTALLSDMGLAEVFRAMPDGDLVRLFVVAGKRKVEGKSFPVYDASLGRLGKAVLDREKNGLAEALFVKGERGRPARGCFVAFWDPVSPEPRPRRRGLISGLLARRKPPAGPEEGSRG